MKMLLRALSKDKDTQEGPVLLQYSRTSVGGALSANNKQMINLHVGQMSYQSTHRLDFLLKFSSRRFVVLQTQEKEKKKTGDVIEL